MQGIVFYNKFLNVSVVLDDFLQLATSVVFILGTIFSVKACVGTIGEQCMYVIAIEAKKGS